MEEGAEGCVRVGVGVKVGVFVAVGWSVAVATGVAVCVVVDTVVDVGVGVGSGVGLDASVSSVATLLSSAVILLSSVERSPCCVATTVSRAVRRFSTSAGTGVACPDTGVGVTVGVSPVPVVGVAVGGDASGKPDTASVKSPVA